MPDDFYMGAEEGEFDDDIQYFRQWLRTGIKKTTGLPLRDSFFGGGSGTGGREGIKKSPDYHRPVLCDSHTQHRY